MFQKQVHHALYKTTAFAKENFGEKTQTQKNSFKSWEVCHFNLVACMVYGPWSIHGAFLLYSEFFCENSFKFPLLFGHFAAFTVAINGHSSKLFSNWHAVCEPETVPIFKLSLNPFWASILRLPRLLPFETAELAKHMCPASRKKTLCQFLTLAWRVISHVVSHLLCLVALLNIVKRCCFPKQWHVLNFGAIFDTRNAGALEMLKGV